MGGCDNNIHENAVERLNHIIRCSVYVKCTGSGRAKISDSIRSHVYEYMIGPHSTQESFDAMCRCKAAILKTHMKLKQY